jgi:hypothetical protein
MQSSNSTQTASKKMKANPSANLVGVMLKSKDAIKVNYRRGKQNCITCNQIECIKVNDAGRRLTLVFKDFQGIELMTRRVYKEHFEKMADKFQVDIF